MPTMTLMQYLLFMFLSEHAAHEQTRRAGADGFVYLECSCGTTLKVPSEL